jgi:hypothetical protein
VGFESDRGPEYEARLESLRQRGRYGNQHWDRGIYAQLVAEGHDPNDPADILHGGTPSDYSASNPVWELPSKDGTAPLIVSLGATPARGPTAEFTPEELAEARARVTKRELKRADKLRAKAERVRAKVEVAALLNEMRGQSDPVTDRLLKEYRAMDDSLQKRLEAG